MSRARTGEGMEEGKKGKELGEGGGEGEGGDQQFLRTQFVPSPQVPRGTHTALLLRTLVYY
jgi:hypothetical protein